MKKYRFKDSNEEIKLGEYVELHVLLDEESLPQLLDAEILEEYEDYSLEDVIEYLAKRKKENVEVMRLFLEVLEGINKKALFTLLLKETSLLIDNDYDGHIKYSKELWGVENISFKLYKLAELQEGQEYHDAPFNQVAAFRNEEDVNKALNILKPIIDKMNG